MVDKRNLDREVDDIFEKYSDFLTEEWAKEMEALLNSRESDDTGSGSADTIETPKAATKCKPSVKYILRTAAVIALVVVFTIIIPSTDASAWRIWPLDFFSNSEDDHTQVGAENENHFVRYYIDDLPEGYNAYEEIITEGIMVKQVYQNNERKIIKFSQYNKDGFVSQIDNENGSTREERIGDFKVMVYEGGDEIIMEITTDTNVIFIYSNDSYEACKVFIENLVEK